ncbi:MAG TPA: MopE-related protein [Candidatus Polarisedimenticolia bacterium]|nr:MopE-related protein [Candidatus Polarisedimenticolia bacterium]
MKSLLGNNHGLGSIRLRQVVGTGAVLAFAGLFAPGILARDLTFEQRVRAQEAIERVYYSHQIGSTFPFEQAVPHALVEAKVRKYLRHSAALDKFWKTPITATMLRAELDRMQHGSRMPERLRELFSALNNDPFLIEECLARPALAERLVGNFFAFDQRIHAETRRLAEAARDAHGPWAMTVTEEREDFVLRESPRERGSAVVHGGAPPLRSFPKLRLEAWWAGIEDSMSIESVHGVGDDIPGDVIPGRQDPSIQSCLTDNTWDNGSLDDFPHGRHSATAVWTGSVMIVWGGIAGELWGYSDSGGRYDPATDTWLSLSLHNAPSPRMNHTAVWTGTDMIVWGGRSGSSMSDGGKYNPVTDTWVSTASSGAPAPRSQHSAIWTGTRMIVWGGQGSSVFNTGAFYDPSADTWAPISTTGAPSARYNHSAVWTGAEMIVWGGGVANGGRYSPSTDSWAPISTTGAPASGPAVWTGSLMLVLSPDATTAGRRYDPSMDAWTPMSRTGAPELNRTWSTVVWAGNRLILWGGQSAGADLNTGGKYDPVTDSWTLTSTVNAPSPRSFHVAVWTGSRMVVWGGYDALNYWDVASGGRYDPTTDSWTPTSESSAPTYRYRLSSVWTGNLMIVWGGVGGVVNFGPLNSGGRYDPALDHWSPTTTINAPAPRRDNSAVWAGGSMIVWGGRDASYFNDGARYDPISDQWTTTSSVGAPEARGRHSVVWTGTRMIVWGGFNGTVRLRTGAAYNPAADSWSPTSLTAAPEARQDAMAVWTGTEMIVWGGSSGSIIVNTGGRYTPSTDSWTPTSMNNAPVVHDVAIGAAVWTGSLMIVMPTTFTGGRYDPSLDQWLAPVAPPPLYGVAGTSVIWTGSRMIVWGGGILIDFGEPIFNMGAIYDPVGNSWISTSTDGAASPRYGHAAVWTGTFMIVWGGVGPAGTSALLNNGGRFIYGQSIDDDGDGFSECAGDCNDSAAAIHPGTTETCNGLDDDCSTLADEGGGLLCDDANGCTTDACAGASGCLHVPRDLDADGHPDALCGGNDCNDASPAVWASPAEVSGLNLTSSSPANPSWQGQATSAGPGTLYDLASGSLGPSTGIIFSAASCLQSSTATTYLDSRSGPASGFAFWYLSRARNSCATATYGTILRDSGIPSCP